MRGRKPKPIELRVLHGSAAETARAAHPQPRRVLPRCPDFLTGEAEKCWKRLARELYDAGLLTTVDRDALAAYCVAFARWRDAEAQVAKKGPVVVTNKQLDADGTQIGGGNPIQNPYLAVANKALEQMSKLMAEFGMTPSSRSRVKAEVSAARAQAQTPTLRISVPTPPGDDPRRALGGD